MVRMTSIYGGVRRELYGPLDGQARAAQHTRVEVGHERPARGGWRGYRADAVHEWSPEVVVDRELVHRLIAGRFPELQLGALGPLGDGWDNSVRLVEDRWVFRFPRRAIARAGVERELALLPRLARLLALPIVFLCAVLALYADHEQIPALEREAIAGLARTWRD